VAGIVPLEPVLDFRLVELYDHRSTVRTGVGILAVVECGQQVDDRALRQRGVPRDRRITGQIPEELVGQRVDGLGARPRSPATNDARTSRNRSGSSVASSTAGTVVTATVRSSTRSA